MKMFLNIAFCFIFVALYSQEKPIKVEIKSLTSKGNFYYTNWENKFKIVTEGVLRKNILVSVTHGTLTAINASVYSLIVSADSSKINFNFSHKIKGKNVFLDSKRRTVKQPNVKGIAINTKFIGEKIKFNKSEFPIDASFTMIFDDDLIHNSLPITTFEYTMIANDGKVHNLSGKGDKISEETKKFIFDCAKPAKGILLEGRSLTPLGFLYSCNTKILMK